MKKIGLAFIVFISLFIIGCTKKNNDDNLKTDTTASVLYMSRKAKNAFKSATKKANKNYKLIALLAKQKVEGMNYLYLALDNKGEWKLITVYLDTSNTATFTSVYNFNYTDYVNEDILNKSDKESSWKIYTSGGNQKIDNTLKKKIKKLEKNDGYSHKIIAELGKSDDTYVLLELVNKNKEYLYKIITFEINDNESKIKSESVFRFEDIIN